MALDIVRNIRLALTTFVLFGLLYSLVLLGIGQVAFPSQANGSLISQHGKIIGSSLIGQNVTSEDLFHGRPSATVNPVTGRPEPYAANNSGGSNLGPTNPALISEIRTNIAAMRPLIGRGPIPLNLVESSGSGLDPEITLQSALVQVPGLARRTGIPQTTLRALVQRQAIGPTFGLYGPWRVNVLDLNLQLLKLQAHGR